MLCEKPYMIGVQPCACNRCFPCRVNRRRLWASRMLLESLVSSDSCFVTLTYDDQNLPAGSTLVPKHVQDWLKRLREVLSPQKIRFFLAGEYGAESLRPHYHVALFGVHPYIAGGADGQAGVVSKTWGLGFTYVGELNHDSAMYIAGYCTKKMTSQKDPRLDGRLPEFSRMSLRPGLGAGAVEGFARALDTDVGFRAIESGGDVPTSFRFSSKSLPLGRYLRGLLREELGFGSRDTPRIASIAYGKEMQRVYAEDVAASKGKKKGIWPIYEEKSIQGIRNLKSRMKVYDQEKKI